MESVPRLSVKLALVGIVVPLIIAVCLFAKGSTDEKKTSIGNSNELAAPSWHTELVQRAAGSNDYEWRKLSFAALHGSVEAMPRSIRRTVRETLGEGQARLRLQFDKSQYLRTVLGIGIWAVKGKGVTCIFHERGNLSACNINVLVARRGLALVAGRVLPSASFHSLPGYFLVLGIAPDQARAVRLGTADGGSKVVRVAHNAFALRTDTPVNIEGLLP